MKFVDWFLRTDEYDPNADGYTIGSPMFWRAIQTIVVIVLVMLAVTALAGVSEDGGDTVRINTYPADEGENQHMVIGIVYVPDKGITYQHFYGGADTVECSSRIADKKAEAEWHAYWVLHRIQETIGDDYIVSLTVSVCHPDWIVVYLTKNKLNASKEVYDKVLNAIQQ